MKTSWRIFGGLAVFLAAAGVVYQALAEEPIGAVLLVLAGGLNAITALYLRQALTPRRLVAPARHEGAASFTQSGAYLPHASVWPFWLGLGALVFANGFAFGLWAIIPGALVLAIGVVGFARQSRRRA